jgi:hypothetical protein
MNIYLISGIIIFIIILAVSLYFGLRPDIKPLPSSSNTCKNNQTQCGTGCYDKTWQSCDSTKQICDSKNFSQNNDTCCIFPEILNDKIQVDDKGNKKKVGTECCRDEYWSSSGNVCCSNPVCGGFCCENTKYCDYSIVGDNEKNNKNNSPCTECPYDLCGKNCCLFNEKCFTGPSGTTYCCNPHLWDPDKKICCNGSTGAISGINCKPGGNPKCINPPCNEQEFCIADDICCDNIYDKSGKTYSCVDQNFNPICCPKDDILSKCQALKNGQYICCEDGFIIDEDSQRCVQICGNQKCDPNLSSCVGSNEYKYCQTKGCVWDTKSNYDPPNYGDNIIFSYKSSEGPKYYYASPTNSDISKKLNRSITYQEIDKDNKCKETDCNGKINEEGALSYFDIETHKCIGNYSHSDIKGFPTADSKPPCPSEGSCVIENGQPTGQICLNNEGIPQKAYNGPNKTSIGGITLNSGYCICNQNDDPTNDNCKNIDVSKTFCPVPLNSDFEGILSLDTGNCSYLYNNNIFNNLNELCSNFDTDENTYGRCYKISANNYKTDKICNRGETCLLENGMYTCVNNSSYCGQYGTWDNVNKKCNCINTDNAGNRCQYSRNDTCFNKGTPTGNGGTCPNDCVMDTEETVSTNTQCNYYNDDVFKESAYNCPSVGGSDPNQNPWHASEPISSVTGSSCGAFGAASEYQATCIRNKGCG